VDFIHLHVHSDFSPQDGAQSTEQIAQRAAKLEMNSVALTDHGRCGGLLSFKKECEKVKVKPIYGLEAYVAPESRLTKGKIDGHKKTSYHLTLLAKNAEGLRNLFSLTSIGWIEGFYYKPRIDMEVLREHAEGLVVLSGCGSGRLSRYLIESHADRIEPYIKEMLEVWGDDFYIEVQNHGFDWQQPLKTLLFEVSDIYSVPIVATQDSHYQTREDADLHRAICRLAAGDLTFEGNESYFKSSDDMCKMFIPKEQHAVERTQEVADKCQCEWEYGKTIWPVFDLPTNITPEKQLQEDAHKGLLEKFPDTTSIYKDRLEHELKVIQKLGFSTYFLVVADFVQWAADNKIYAGTGRGSGCGSLVAYCIGITKVDPIKYGLFFERFLNESRVSPPDFDIDWPPDKRKDVMQYVYDKYGHDKCAQIGTYAVFKPRGSLRDFARVLGYPTSAGDELASLVPPDVAGKALKFKEVIKAEPKILKTNYPDVVKMAMAAEGLVSQAGVHAAGVIISDQELRTQVPLFRGKHDEVAAQFDMHDVEEIGLIKYDFLGLKNLTVIQETIKSIKEYKNINIDINSINLEDQNVYNNIFQQGRLDGIFQFETSSGFRDLCIQVKPKSVEDLAAVTSIFRPGPLSAGLSDKYVNGRNGKPVEYLIPGLEPILNTTYGSMIFQEQVMRICTDVAGYTLVEADNMRKIIGKKLPEKMKLERGKFVGGCTNQGIKESAATQLFDDIEGYSKYSFNLSHAIAYSIISYQTAWLKHYYLEEFYCALFNSSLRDQEDLIKYFHACREDGIPIQPPDINTSGTKFVVNDGTIVFGLAGVKGLGEKACNMLIELRPTGGFESIEHMITCGINKGAVKALAACGALEEISDISRSILLYNIDPLIKFYERLDKWNERNKRIAVREKEITAAVDAGNKPPRRLPKNRECPEYPELEDVPSKERKNKLTLERETLGFYLTGHPMNDFPGLLHHAQHTVQDLKEGKAFNSEKIHLPIVISALNERRTRKGQNMAVLTIEDKSGRIEATIFPRQWRKLKSIAKEDTVSIIDGTVRMIEVDGDVPPIVRIIVNNIKIVNEQDINPIDMKLKDGTRIKFTPAEDQSFSAYQQALAIVSNTKRMEQT